MRIGEVYANPERPRTARRGRATSVTMDHPVVVAARGLAATLAAHTDDHVRARALAPAVIDALTAGDCWRLLVPRALGGLALTPADYVDVLTALAAGDAASAWVVMTASTSTLLAGYLPPATARGIWGAGAAPICAGVFAPGGRLTPEGDGLRLRGRWPYASGCQHASWALVGAQSGEPPRHVVCAVPIAAPGVTIVDTWDPIGLAGTGSHDLVIDTTLPATAVTSVFDQAAWLDEPLARVPLFGLLALGIAGVALGVAGRALGLVAERFAAARAGQAPPSPALASYATLRARLDAAAAATRAVALRAQAAAEAGTVDDDLRGALRATAAHTAATCAELGRAAFHLVGGAAIGRSSPLARAVADLEVLLTHRMVADRVLPTAARALLGQTAPADL